MSTARIRLPDKIKKGEVVEIKTLIPHTMESGQRRDAAGAVIPRKIIKNFACTLDGKEIVRADWGAAIAANPLFGFFLRAEKSGTLEFAWTDDDGTVTKQTAKLEVG